MKSTSTKPYSGLIAADFPYCPLPDSPWPTQSASRRGAKVRSHECASGESTGSPRHGSEKFIMTVLIGVKESMDDSAMAELLLSLRGNIGISSAQQSHTRHILMIEYDPSLARRRDILALLGDRGLHACVAGC